MRKLFTRLLSAALLAAILISVPATAETVPMTTEEVNMEAISNIKKAVTGTPIIKIKKQKTKKKISAAPGTVLLIDTGTKVAKKFKSSNEKIATVTYDGIVTIKRAGKVMIGFKIGKKKGVLALQIKDPTIPKKVEISSPIPLTGKVGTKIQLTAVLPKGTRSDVKWKSSNKKIVTVSKDGIVTFKKKGTAEIGVVCTRGKKKAKVKVKVN